VKPLDERGAVHQTWLAEVVEERLALLEEEREKVRSHYEDVSLTQCGPLRFSARQQILVRKRLAGVEVIFASISSDVEKHTAANDASLRDRLNARLLQAPDGASRVEVIPKSAVVPDMTESVVLSGALQERRQLVVGIVMPTRGYRTTTTFIPIALVKDLGPFGLRSPRPYGVAPVISDEPLERKDMARLHELGGAKYFVGT
jgi:hypothetical protein